MMTTQEPRSPGDLQPATLRAEPQNEACNLRPDGNTQEFVRLYTRRAALVLFLLYLAVFPGSTITVALGRVPAWGEWMGGALLLLQGAIVLCWLVGGYGWRGALTAALVFPLAWGVEHLGVTTGFPFGRYSYTAQLQPQLLGAVPLAIPCAWLVVAVGVNDLRFLIFDFRLSQDVLIKNQRSKIKNSAFAATLVLLLDMQIEPVASAINRYWVWHDGGAYYGVPAANFAAWWVVGLVMAVVVRKVLGGAAVSRFSERIKPITLYNKQDMFRLMFYILRSAFDWLPASLYLLNTLMFAAINLARGYVTAGVVGLAVLIASALVTVSLASRRAAFQVSRSR